MICVTAFYYLCVMRQIIPRTIHVTYVTYTAYLYGRFFLPKSIDWLAHISYILYFQYAYINKNVAREKIIIFCENSI